MTATITYSNTGKLNKTDQLKLQSLIEKELFKVERVCPKDLEGFAVNIKVHHTTGRREKYSLHVKAVFPKKVFAVQEADWDVRKVVHKVANSLEKEIESHSAKPERRFVHWVKRFWRK